jgi:PEP-CTERM motif
MRKYILAIGLAISSIAPAHAGPVLIDNFDTENGGNTALNYAGFANFTSSGAGNVDIVKSGDYGIVCSGICIDLDGSPGPGALTSNSFSFGAGDTVRLFFDIGGNQRNGDNDAFGAGFSFAGSANLSNYGFNYFGSDTNLGAYTGISGISTGSSVLGSAGFSQRSIFFTALNAGSFTFNFSSPSNDNIGPLLDNVRLDVSSAVPEPSTWMMMILGFGLAGFAMRRRKILGNPAFA